MKLRTGLMVVCLLAPLTAVAETVYIIDRLQVGLRAQRDGTSTVVKSLETGAALEVLERSERFVRVRDKAGTEGWIEARYVGAELPARAQLAKLQEELNKARAQLAEAQARPNNAAPAPVVAAETEADYELDYIWFFVALGMLAVGFIAGILWHRESIRRRMGGMYLRI
jgi:uncharacterized protein YgiM (DUF1202 family)